MKTVQITEQVPKELHEVNVALLGICTSVKKALENGWQPSEDMPAIVMDSVRELAPAIDGLGEVPVEISEDSAGAIMSGGWFVSKLLKLFKKAA